MSTKKFPDAKPNQTGSVVRESSTAKISRSTIIRLRDTLLGEQRFRLNNTVKVTTHASLLDHDAIIDVAFAIRLSRLPIRGLAAMRNVSKGPRQPWTAVCRVQDVAHNFERMNSNGATTSAIGLEIHLHA